MGADQNIEWSRAASSALEWWADAGVDTIVDETPRDWLARVAPALPVNVEVAVAAVEALPGTLAEFASWRIGADAPEAGWHGAPIAAQGDPAADILILIDMPEREDAESGILMSGAAGRLFDRMLAAIGRSRETVYIVPLCAVRPAAGRIAPEIETRLGELAVHHIALAGPKCVLILGNAPSRALLGMDFLRARGGLRSLNLEASTVGIALQAVASFHPRFLLEKPMAKAEAWKDLQMLIGGLES